MTDSLSYLEPVEGAQRVRLSLTALILIIGAMLVIIVLGISLARAGETQLTSGPAPDFKLRTFEGDWFSLDEYRGNVVIVNFWASWCVTCREEAPVLQSVWERYRDQGVAMVGVAYLDVERDGWRSSTNSVSLIQTDSISATLFPSITGSKVFRKRLS